MMAARRARVRSTFRGFFQRNRQAGPAAILAAFSAALLHVTGRHICDENNTSAELVCTRAPVRAATLIPSTLKSRQFPLVVNLVVIAP